MTKQKIEIRDGYIELKPFVTRQAARVYNDTLFADAKMNQSGDATVNPAQVERASEALVMALIERIVKIENGAEIEVIADNKWLDNLDDKDFKKLELAVLTMKNREDENVKK